MPKTQIRVSKVINGLFADAGPHLPSETELRTFIDVDGLEAKLMELHEAGEFRADKLRRNALASLAETFKKLFPGRDMHLVSVVVWEAKGALDQGGSSYYYGPRDDVRDECDLFWEFEGGISGAIGDKRFDIDIGTTISMDIDDQNGNIVYFTVPEIEIEIYETLSRYVPIEEVKHALTEMVDAFPPVQRRALTKHIEQLEAYADEDEEEEEEEMPLPLVAEEDQHVVTDFFKTTTA